ncbi:GntR family transcriptional regulator YhfZ [Vibrio sp. ES.051]|uniref:GntR family transcriptional regulator YhfZ n=1 Tax=Vibrio sp. ES.051 TaxID=1761909 RepID=UPI0015CF1131|nr:GntR family transcriptional regulator YhfZ [Vibrio sp. ES.051]
MLDKYLSKEGQSLVAMSRYLLATEEGTKLKTVEELAEDFDISIGYASRALKTMEKNAAITVSKGGRNGTVLLAKDHRTLFEMSGLSKLICSMPLPYTKKYEGLSSAIKAQLDDVYFAYMKGATLRGECLANGVYDMAIMSELAAKSVIEKSDTEVAVNLGPHSYTVGHRLIYRKDEKSAVKKVGVDPESPDQMILTKMLFAEQSVEFIEINYNDGLTSIQNHAIDAMVWEVKDIALLELLDLQSELIDHPHKQELSSAVILIRKEDIFLKNYLINILDTSKLLAHQAAVCEKVILPSY